MTDDTVVRKRGRKAPSDIMVQSSLLLGDEPAGQEDTQGDVQTQPEDAPRPDPKVGEFKRTLKMVRVTPMTPTLVQYVGSTIPKGMWQLVPVSGNSMEALWGAWRAEFGAGDPERFLRTLFFELGIAMDGTIKTVSTLTLR